MSINHEYLTYVRTDRPCNKSVKIIKGEAVKSSGDSMFSDATATTRHVPTLEALNALLVELADDEHGCLVNGFIKGTEDGTSYQLTSKKFMSKLKGQTEESLGLVTVGGVVYARRCKDNFTPSCWWQIDCDKASGLPEHLDPPTINGYLDLMAKLLPDFATCGYVRVATTTGRCLVKGEPMNAKGSRYWFKARQPELMEGFGKRLKLYAASIGLGFMKLDKNGKGILWSIFDSSVFSPERLVFDGKPRLEPHPDLSLAKPNIDIVHADDDDPIDVDVSSVPDMSEADKAKLKANFNIVVGANGSQVTIENHSYLTMDTQVETQERGVITVAEFVASGEERLRCQSTFRDSDSWNGALKIGKVDGKPYLQDFGGETIYRLVKEPIPIIDPNDPMAWSKSFMLDDEQVEAIADPEWIIEDLVVQGHLIVIAAKPNAGKTALMTDIAALMVKAGKEVSYVNADASGSDTKAYHYHAKKHGYKALFPAMAVDGSMGKVVDKLKGMAATDVDLSAQVFIFDTLKKMTDVIQKKQLRELLAMLRRLTAMGATVICLGHCNKYRSAEGDLIYEGTGDLESDVDELIYLETGTDKLTGDRVISTYPKKFRSAMWPISFKMDSDPSRTCTQLEDYIDIKADNIVADKAHKLEADNKWFVAETERLLRGGDMKVTEIKEGLSGGQVGQNRIGRMLRELDGQRWTITKNQANNASIVSLKNNPFPAPP